MLYATLDDAQSVMSASATAATTAEKNKLLADLRTVSRRIDREFMARRPLFGPYIETRKLSVRSELVNSYDGTLLITGAGSLLELTTVTQGDTALTIGTNVEAWPDSAMPPLTHLRLMEGALYDWYSYSVNDTARPLQVTITGVWGVHRDYDHAWMHVDDLQATIDADDTAVTVADADGADAYGLTPRLSPGNLLKIDDEYLEVTGVSTNTLTVRRGVNGSTAAAHTGAVGTGGADIATWQVEEPVRRAVARQTALIYARRGAYSSVEIDAIGGTTKYPGDWLTEVRASLADYAYGV